MNARATQADAVQGADEERKEDVQDRTATAHRNQQRSNVPASTDSVSGSAAEQGSTVRGSYEIAVLYHPDLEVDLSKAEEKVTGIVTGNGGKVVSTDNWGKRKLAYPINKQDYAVYVFYTVDLSGESVQKVESTLNITDEVIRYLITKPDLKAMAKAEKLKAEKAKKAAERGDAADDKDAEEDE